MPKIKESIGQSSVSDARKIDWKTIELNERRKSKTNMAKTVIKS